MYGLIDRECETCGSSYKGNRLRCKACLSEVPRKTFKYRIYPNKATVEKLQWILDRCRELYNAALQERSEAYAYEKKSIGSSAQSRELTEIKRTIRPEYQEINDHVLRDALKRIDIAFSSFLNGGGYPHYQKRDTYNSFTYPDQWGWKLIPGEKKNGKLSLTKIGNIKVRMHRPIEGTIKMCTIARDKDQWFVCFSCELSATGKLPTAYEDVGIDVGIIQFAALSDGSFIENPHYYRQAEHNLAKLDQSLARKTNGKSKRRKKTKRQLSRAHRKIRNQRKDFLHKESRKLINRFQVIAMEDLKVENMVRKPKIKQDAETEQYLPNGASAKAGLNKSILDAGWATFRRMLENKAKNAGRIIKPVPAMYTSQTCSQCGHVSPDNRKSQAEFECVKCGYTENADTNAAITILQKAQEN